MIKAIAVDDEPIALEVLKKHANKTPGLQLEATFVNAFQALEYLETHAIDLIFLDISMPDISGIDFYKKLIKKPLLVFTTAYSEHAITGFELQALDYLLKPFTLERFQKCYDKAIHYHEAQKKTINHIFIKDGYKTLKINIEEILFLEATGNYIRYVLPDKEVLARSTVKETLQLLPSTIFIQSHRSFIVNVKHIDKIEKQHITIVDRQIPIGLSYTNQIRKLLHNE